MAVMMPKFLSTLASTPFSSWTMSGLFCAARFRLMRTLLRVSSTAPIHFENWARSPSLGLPRNNTSVPTSRMRESWSSMAGNCTTDADTIYSVSSEESATSWLSSAASRISWLIAPRAAAWVFRFSVGGLSFQFGPAAAVQVILTCSSALSSFSLLASPATATSSFCSLSATSASIATAFFADASADSLLASARVVSARCCSISCLASSAGFSSFNPVSSLVAWPMVVLVMAIRRTSRRAIAIALRPPIRANFCLYGRRSMIALAGPNISMFHPTYIVGLPGTPRQAEASQGPPRHGTVPARNARDSLRRPRSAQTPCRQRQLSRTSAQSTRLPAQRPATRFAADRTKERARYP